MRQRTTSIGPLVFAAVFVAFACAPLLQAQTCDAWKSVVGWQGTYSLFSSGEVMHGQTNRFFINEISDATVNMTNMTGGLCNYLHWQGADLNNTGGVNDQTQVLNGCMEGQWFTTDTLMGDSGYPSNSELTIDFTGGSFSFSPIAHDFVTHTVYNCEGSQSGQEGWGTYPATNWPLNFQLPQQVGPLTITNFPFRAANHYAGYEDVDWTISFNLTPILASDKNLTVAVQGSGRVTSVDGAIDCPGICSHYYSPNTQVTLNATPGQGFTFVGWSGACTGTGSCNVTMTQDQPVGAVFSGPLQFVAVTPCRIVDTRNANGPFGGPILAGHTTRNFPLAEGDNPCAIPSTAVAYSLNVAVVPSGGLNYLTMWPAGQPQPFVATLNSLDGRVKSNAAIVSAGSPAGAVSVYATNTTQVILDVNGYFIPATQNTLQFYPLTPCRVVDTRDNVMPPPPPGLGGPYLGNREVRDLPILASPCLSGVNNPKAYSLNVAVVPHPAGTRLNYLTVWPSDQRQPLVATLNNPTATVVANAAIVPAAANGHIKVFAYNSTDVIMDINGYFADPGPNGLSLYAAPPCRVYDSRDNHGQPFHGTRAIDVAGSPCAPPAMGGAYVFSATVVPSGPMPYLTLWPDGSQQPFVATLNAYDGYVTSNMAIVPNDFGTIDAYVDGLTHLVLDISGYFAH